MTWVRERGLRKKKENVDFISLLSRRIESVHNADDYVIGLCKAVVMKHLE